MIKYTVFGKVMTAEYIGEYTAWGIEAKYPDGTTAGRIEDISSQREYVEAMAEMLNNGEAEAVHLRDIVDDMLASQKSTLLDENIVI